MHVPCRRESRFYSDLHHFIFHVDCFKVLRAYGHRPFFRQIWHLGLALNLSLLPLPPKFRLRRDRSLGEALLKLNSDCFSSARDELNLFFRLPLELQHVIAGEVFPCMYSRLAVALTTTAPLLKLEDQWATSLELVPFSLNVGDRLIRFVENSYLRPIVFDGGRPDSRDSQEPRRIRVGIDDYGVQKVELEWGDSDDKPSPCVAEISVVLPREEAYC